MLSSLYGWGGPVPPVVRVWCGPLVGKTFADFTVVARVESRNPKPKTFVLISSTALLFEINVGSSL